jgi:hypothetical protein
MQKWKSSKIKYFAPGGVKRAQQYGMASSEVKGEPYGELGAMTGTPVLAPWHKGLNVLFR